MQRTSRALLAVLATLAVVGGVMAGSADPAGADDPRDPRPPCPRASVTSDQPAIPNRFVSNAFDGSTGSFFATEHLDWQYVQVDFGCVGTFSGFSRLMTLGNSGAGHRGRQGEAVSYSTDGRTWTRLTGSTTTGWEGYMNYRPHAWHSVSFGWSERLRLDVPADARYVRFHWDGAPGHFLHELRIDFTPPPLPPSVDLALHCDAGAVLCTATASGGSGGGFSFAWQPGTRTTITTQTDRATVSSVVGSCLDSAYTMAVTATDGQGLSATRQVTRPCGGTLR